MNMVIGAALGGVAGLFHGAILLGIIEGAAAGAAVFWIDQNNGTLQRNWVSVSPWYMYRASILSQVAFLSLTAAMNFFPHTLVVIEHKLKLLPRVCLICVKSCNFIDSTS